ncbi:MAG: FHA domain-containing protein [Candidatus Symbiothrix sp.]|jgi:pSer/pThr/pTyr-binding forkhead associated (FHA) protein|nr:FHA domain-containing protein [Candidatus Symbiothrix sp.]
MKVITIGRHTNNDVVINDSKISRNHLQIIQDDSNQFKLVDFNSTNGTFVNGRRISGEVQLHPNDSVKIADSILPWQTYFDEKPNKPNKPADSVMPLTPAKSNSKLWIIVAAALVSVLLIGGISFVVINNNKKTEQAQIAEQEQKKKEAQAQQIEQEAMDAVQAAVDLRIAAEEATRIAAQSKSKEDIELRDKAIAAQKKAEEDAEKKKKAVEEEAKAKVDAANKKAKAEAVTAKQLQEELTNKQQAFDKKEKEKQDSLDRVNIALKEAQARNAQTIQFNKLLENGVVTETLLTSVCNHFQYNVPEGLTAKKTLEQKFNDKNTSIERRTEIIVEISKQGHGK